MPRIRTIKPEFWSNEKLSDLSLTAHMLAAALLNYADDEGYFNAHPALVRAGTFPLRREFTLETVAADLEALRGVDYWRKWQGPDGRVYGWIRGFTTHQRVSHPSPSKIRAFFEFARDSGETPEMLRSGSRALPETFGSTRDILVPEQGTGNRERGRRSPPTPSSKRRGRGPPSRKPDAFSNLPLADGDMLTRKCEACGEQVPLPDGWNGPGRVPPHDCRGDL